MVSVSPRVLLVAVAVALSIWVDGEVVHGTKVVSHKICHFITLGHKCK